MLNLILKTLIPTDTDLSMPSAAEIDFHNYVIRHGIQEVVFEITTLIDTLAQDQLKQSFEWLGDDDRLKIINACRTTDIRLFSTFLTHVFRAYYSNQNVLERIDSGATPPFPDGNHLESDDWTILAPVYERGPIHRNAEVYPS